MGSGVLALSLLGFIALAVFISWACLPASMEGSPEDEYAYSPLEDDEKQDRK